MPAIRGRKNFGLAAEVTYAANPLIDNKERKSLVPRSAVDKGRLCIFKTAFTAFLNLMLPRLYELSGHFFIFFNSLIILFYL